MPFPRRSRPLVKLQSLRCSYLVKFQSPRCRALVKFQSPRCRPHCSWLPHYDSWQYAGLFFSLSRSDLSFHPGFSTCVPLVLFESDSSTVVLLQSLPCRAAAAAAAAWICTGMSVADGVVAAAWICSGLSDEQQLHEKQQSPAACRSQVTLKTS